ncbi:NAD+ synthetase [Sphaeroforma arctica JP610]|uniref:NAD+ synthetase n=1 Tax=Sphaeroforma arctica JP610 TaxID=667725 RepID=A0A0L0GAP4_9EUKA|nr:NAD+ synthetase [Sphaeroforma arctica JP610]KNC85971.1 NAD+ synthetase [Sphaeroforma arctica JP610]|eukprot:XP_014159873.1 NAD+ synthetase [Sphaeroforma arctica JP610]
MGEVLLHKFGRFARGRLPITFQFDLHQAGDGVVDVQLISDLHKSEVFKVGHELGVPKSTLEAAPSADLWDGQEDEEELGFTYDFIELYTG